MRFIGGQTIDNLVLGCAQNVVRYRDLGAEMVWPFEQTFVM